MYRNSIPIKGKGGEELVSLSYSLSSYIHFNSDCAIYGIRTPHP
jgi:hypothetical protein